MTHEVSEEPKKKRAALPDALGYKRGRGNFESAYSSGEKRAGSDANLTKLSDNPRYLALATREVEESVVDVPGVVNVPSTAGGIILVA